MFEFGRSGKKGNVNPKTQVLKTEPGAPTVSLHFFLTLHDDILSPQ
jgi:hypothetical protein